MEQVGIYFGRMVEGPKINEDEELYVYDQTCEGMNVLKYSLSKVEVEEEWGSRLFKSQEGARISTFRCISVPYIRSFSPFCASAVPCYF